jgi:ASC-1-like (ASCH) protein
LVYSYIAWTKTCEGRLHKHRFKNYKIGDIIKWWNNDFDKGRVCFTKIININLYKTFEEYLIDKGLKKLFARYAEYGA